MLSAMFIGIHSPWAADRPLMAFRRTTALRSFTTSRRAAFPLEQLSYFGLRSPAEDGAGDVDQRDFFEFDCTIELILRRCVPFRYFLTERARLPLGLPL